jgi:hypothetical protein
MLRREHRESGATVFGCVAFDGGATFNNIWAIAEH